MELYEEYRERYEQAKRANDVNTMEQMAERFMDAIDKVFLSSDMSQEDYDRLAKLD